MSKVSSLATIVAVALAWFAVSCAGPAGGKGPTVASAGPTTGPSGQAPILASASGAVSPGALTIAPATPGPVAAAAAATPAAASAATPATPVAVSSAPIDNRVYFGGSVALFAILGIFMILLRGRAPEEA